MVVLFVLRKRKSKTISNKQLNQQNSAELIQRNHDYDNISKVKNDSDYGQLPNNNQNSNEYSNLPKKHEYENVSQVKNNNNQTNKGQYENVSTIPSSPYDFLPNKASTTQSENTGKEYNNIPKAQNNYSSLPEVDSNGKRDYENVHQ